MYSTNVNYVSIRDGFNCLYGPIISILCTCAGGCTLSDGRVSWFTILFIRLVRNKQYFRLKSQSFRLYSQYTKINKHLISWYNTIMTEVATVRKIGGRRNKRQPKLARGEVGSTESGRAARAGGASIGSADVLENSTRGRDHYRRELFSLTMYLKVKL